MQRVLVWEHAGNSEKWCKTYLQKNEVEILQTIKPSQPVPEILLRSDAWDWLLIFGSKKALSVIDTTIKTLKLPLEKVVYTSDADSWVQHPKAITLLLNYTVGTRVRRKLLLNDLKKLNTFVTCTVEGLSYIAPSKDPYRVPQMFVRQVNHASNDMKRFYELSNQYYKTNDLGKGYFLDLGANIGSTGLYFIKKLAPDLKLLAFEPDPENLKMHRCNMILNDLEKQTILVNCGLSNEINDLMLYRNSANSGANGFIKHEESVPIAKIKIIPLDLFLRQRKIAASEVRYVWIDTEGFEARVLLGAKDLLAQNPAPIFMECNLRAWDESGYFEDMMTLLEKNYSHFVHFYKGETLYPLDALRTMQRPKNALGQSGNIFLIKKGAIV